MKHYFVQQSEKKSYVLAKLKMFDSGTIDLLPILNFYPWLHCMTRGAVGLFSLKLTQGYLSPPQSGYKSMMFLIGI